MFHQKQHKALKSSTIIKAILGELCFHYIRSILCGLAETSRRTYYKKFKKVFNFVGYCGLVLIVINFSTYFCPVPTG